jgi:hypothetical protein
VCVHDGAQKRFVASSDSPETAQLFLCADKPALRAAVQFGLPLGTAAPVDVGAAEGGSGVTASGGVGGGGSADSAGGGGAGGSSSSSGGVSSKIVLFSDAWEAVVCGHKGTAKAAPGTIHALLVCRVCLGHSFTSSTPVCIGCADAGGGGGGGAAPDIPMSCECALAPTDLSEAGSMRMASSVAGKGGRGGGRYACVMRGTNCGRVLPEYYVLAAEASPGHHGAAEVSEEAIEAAITRVTNLWGGLPEGVRARLCARAG